MTSKSHGSVGVGIGSTIERNLTPYKLYTQDIFYPSVLQQKLEAIKNYYSDILRNKFPTFNFLGHDMLAVLMESIFSEEKIKFNLDKSLKLFMQAVEKCKGYIKLKTESEMFARDYNPYDDFIFEGSQGILLDMDFGFFPNVTRTNTTSKNAMEIIERNNLDKPDIYYMTRCYQTRHGNGWMSDHRDLKLINNENETNVQHDWQGNFRTGVLDFDLLNYAIGCDNNFTSHCPKHLVVTCLDQIKGDLCAIKDDGMTQVVIKDDKQWFDNINVGITKLFKSHSDCSDNLKDGIYLYDITKEYVNELKPISPEPKFIA
jgi:adenylosuccinate synthase